MRQESTVVTRQAEVWPAAGGSEAEMLAAALAAALVEYKKCARDGACGGAADAGAGPWRTLGRWEQLAGTRRA